jgi:hypothetical protein
LKKVAPRTLGTFASPTLNPLWLEKDHLIAKKLKSLVEQLEQRMTAMERALASSRVADAAPQPTTISETDKAQSIDTPVKKRSLSPEAREPDSCGATEALGSEKEGYKYTD